MKIKVQRELTEGQYTVLLIVSEFTEEERQKFLSFGVPMVSVQSRATQMVNGRITTVFASRNVPITELAKHPAKFGNEAAAREYEAKVLTEVKNKMTALRERKDDFSSSEEISL